MGTDIDRPFNPEQKVEFNIQGLGTCRSSGALIILLLSLEDEIDRAGILADAAKELGISLEELTHEYKAPVCRQCMCSIKMNGLCSRGCPREAVNNG